MNELYIHCTFSWLKMPFKEQPCQTSFACKYIHIIKYLIGTSCTIYIIIEWINQSNWVNKTLLHVVFISL